MKKLITLLLAVVLVVGVIGPVNAQAASKKTKLKFTITMNKGDEQTLELINQSIETLNADQPALDTLKWKAKSGKKYAKLTQNKTAIKAVKKGKAVFTASTKKFSITLTVKVQNAKKTDTVKEEFKLEPEFEPHDWYIYFDNYESSRLWTGDYQDIRTYKNKVLTFAGEEFTYKWVYLGKRSELDIKDLKTIYSKSYDKTVEYIKADFKAKGLTATDFTENTFKCDGKLYDFNGHLTYSEATDPEQAVCFEYFYEIYDSEAASYFRYNISVDNGNQDCYWIQQPDGYYD